jgi:hypothetical protein
LIAALGGVFLTGVIGIVRTVFDHRHERRVKESDHTHELQVKELEVKLAAEAGRRSDRRQSYGEFLASTDSAYQRAADLYSRARKGENLSYREETKDVIPDLMRRELTVALVGTSAVRQDAKAYVSALRQ